MANWHQRKANHHHKIELVEKQRILLLQCSKITIFETQIKSIAVLIKQQNQFCQNFIIAVRTLNPFTSAIILQTMPLNLLLLLAIITHSLAIRFNYNLSKYQIQCFHESVEKDSRYQIATKGETSQFYLHVVETEVVHEDTRSSNAEFKQYSAFAGSNTIITFCIGNLGDKAIYFDIQFYHGIFLEDSFQTNVRGRELQDLSDRWSNMLKMVQSNYEIYRRHLFGRRASSQRISIVLTFMVGATILVTAVIKCVYFKKITHYLKQKKVM